ncbi:hypothetical protein K438DRAFT_1984887 [Mycena galopus ATCC 62051]|nr:hypothetical protein K438DRAFT_1984887 [Mycena galopus ATCC 62051]
MNPEAMPELMIEPLLYRVIATYCSSWLQVWGNSMSPSLVYKHLEFSGSYPVEVIKIFILCDRTINSNFSATLIDDGSAEILLAPSPQTVPAPILLHSGTAIPQASGPGLHPLPRERIGCPLRL